MALPMPRLEPVTNTLSTHVNDPLHGFVAVGGLEHGNVSAGHHASLVFDAAIEGAKPSWLCKTRLT